MKPVRLELSGFTAFREKSEVDFTRLDLFAITGPTGAGKTSLLDAITYALYGKTPRLSKAGRDLISQGATAMNVTFEFQAGGRNYRVARGIRGSSSQIRLETFESGAWKPAAGRVGDVNAEIQKLIGLDFAGFTKTVMLPQGLFDVFLRGDPKERREVLSELLDVKIYGRMTVSANSKSKDLNIRAEERERTIDAGATEEVKAAVESELAGLRLRLEEASARSEMLRKALPQALALRENRRAILQSESQRGPAAAGIARLRDEVAGLDETLAAGERKIEESLARLGEVPYDAEEHLRLKELLPKAERLAKVTGELTSEQGRWMKTSGQLAQAQKKVEEAEGAREAAAEALERAESADTLSAAALEELHGKFGSPDRIRLLLEEIDRLQAEMPAVAREEDELRQFESRLEALEVETGSAAMLFEQAEAKLRKNEELLEHMQTVHRGASLRLALKEGGACPVCEQTVHELPSAPDAAELTEAQAKVKGARIARERAQQKLNVLENESANLPSRIAQTRQSLTARRQRIAQIESRIPAGGKAALSAAIEQSTAAERAAAESKRRLDRDRTAHTQSETQLQQARHAREMVEAEIRRAAQRVADLEQEKEKLAASLAGDTDAGAISAALAGLDRISKQRRALEEQLRRCEDEQRRARQISASQRQDLAGLEAKLQAVEANLARLREEGTAIQESLRQLAGESEPDRIVAFEEANRGELGKLGLDIQRVEIDIAGLTSRIQRNAELREEVGTLRQDSAVYRDLGLWLNGSNFQQYLLKSAYDILTREGSRHLSSLSAGRYDFVFEDDEFAVADHANAGDTRSVRTLSGGESFLASLSLALALAQSITQLNGERGAINLESLFLDEGFSTLDPEALGKVADALEVLHGGHRLVGIITHVASLAEQMPARIEVVKGPGGSRVVQDSDAAAFQTASG